MPGGSGGGGRAQAQQEVALGAARPGPAPCAAPLWLRLAAAGGAVRGGPGSRGRCERGTGWPGALCVGRRMASGRRYSRCPGRWALCTGGPGAVCGIPWALCAGGTGSPMLFAELRSCAGGGMGSGALCADGLAQCRGLGMG